MASIINARVEEILEMVNTELKAYGAYEQKRKLIAGIVLTGGGSNLKNLRQLANYVTGFDARIGFANEYIANDKNQYLKSPEFATSIGLLMESLKIHDKKPIEKPVEEPKVIEVPQTENTVEEAKTEEQEITQHIEEVKKNKLTFGHSILEKVNKLFEEVESSKRITLKSVSNFYTSKLSGKYIKYRVFIRFTKRKFIYHKSNWCRWWR